MIIAPQRFDQFRNCITIHQRRLGKCLVREDEGAIAQAIAQLEQGDFDRELLRQLREDQVLLQEDEEGLTHWVELCAEGGCTHLKARFLTRFNKVQLADLDVHLAAFGLFIMMVIISSRILLKMLFAVLKKLI